MAANQGVPWLQAGTSRSVSALPPAWPRMEWSAFTGWSEPTSAGVARDRATAAARASNPNLSTTLGGAGVPVQSGTSKINAMRDAEMQAKINEALGLTPIGGGTGGSGGTGGTGAGATGGIGTGGAGGNIATTRQNLFEGTGVPLSPAQDTAFTNHYQNLFRSMLQQADADLARRAAESNADLTFGQQNAAAQSGLGWGNVGARLGELNTTSSLNNVSQQNQQLQQLLSILGLA